MSRRMLLDDNGFSNTDQAQLLAPDLAFFLACLFEPSWRLCYFFEILAYATSHSPVMHSNGLCAPQIFV